MNGPNHADKNSTRHRTITPEDARVDLSKATGVGGGDEYAASLVREAKPSRLSVGSSAQAERPTIPFDPYHRSNS